MDASKLRDIVNSSGFPLQLGIQTQIEKTPQKGLTAYQGRIFRRYKSLLEIAGFDPENNLFGNLRFGYYLRIYS
jgi:hypothetical protein